MKSMLTLVLMLLVLLASVAGAQEAREDMTLEQRVAALEAQQEGIPGHTFMVSGYANVQFVEPEEGDSTFSTLFAPIFLFKHSDRLLFEGELEFEFEGDETEVGVEYAQVDYMFSDNAIFVGGKFLLPLGVFGERIHPSWINKLPTAPIIYGGHGGSAAGMIPVMSDFGVQLRGGFATGPMRWNYAAYAVNGPRANVDEHEEEEGGHHAEAPVNYEPTSEDDNDNKAVGLRVGILPISGLELGVSYYSGMVTYNEFVAEDQAPGEETENPIVLTMVDFTYQWSALRLEGEYLIEDSDKIDEYVIHYHEGPPPETEEQHIPGERVGYWVQGSYAFSGWIPDLVLRYGETTSDGEDVGSQTAFGLNWWLQSSAVLKLAAVTNELEEEDGTETTTDYYVALAMGF